MSEIVKPSWNLQFEEYMVKNFPKNELGMILKTITKLGGITEGIGLHVTEPIFPKPGGVNFNFRVPNDPVIKKRVLEFVDGVIEIAISWQK